MSYVPFFTSFIVTVLVSLLIVLIFYGLTVIGYWLVFTKARQPNWSALIPFYNTYIQYKIAWDVFWFWAYIGGLILYMILQGHGWFLNVLSYLPLLVSLGVSVMAALKLARAFGKSLAFGVGLFLLGPVFLLILGLDHSGYYGPQP